MEKETVLVDGVSFHLRRATEYVIDDYDQYLGSVELSHYEDLGYDIVTGYSGDVSTIDLTWVKKEDVIELKTNENLERVFINCLNSKTAKFYSDNSISFEMIVNCNVVVAGSALKRFLANNASKINNINFYNVTNVIVKRYLEELCHSYGISAKFVVQDMSNVNSVDDSRMLK